ncbi:VPLPA-CTERM sorting domain-containing protein [uncultured Roseobacter sp.]|uniref:VPLPA-CTERM sorting domain-containing protein n=1 Tax=uncultured Roseobacter sp. TaxID=114847 RepID=UPI0026275016|nr:VPLPA-CTERM sorting domain-containing protein [uncultured Roseobacter sp.]
MKKLLAIGVFAVVAATHSVSAAVVDGLVTSGAGSFEEIVDTTGLTVGQNNQQSDNLFAFNEAQNVKLTSDLSTDMGGSISAGTVVSSHYVFFDPVRGFQEGFVDFDSPILAVITSLGALTLSDFLGDPEVTYLSPALRGLESGDSVGIDPGIGTRLLVDWFASSPGDYVRVITEGELAVVPVPASGLLLLGGLGMIVVARRRRKV